MQISFRRTRCAFAIIMSSLVVVLGLLCITFRPLDREQSAALEVVNAFLAARGRSDFDAAEALLAHDVTLLVDGNTRAGFDWQRDLMPRGATYTLGAQRAEGSEVIWIETVVQHTPEVVLQTSRQAIIDGSASMPEPTPHVQPRTRNTRAVRAVVQDGKITSVAIGVSDGVEGVGVRGMLIRGVLLAALAVTVVACVALRVQPARQRSVAAGRLMLALHATLGTRDAPGSPSPSPTAVRSRQPGGSACILSK